MLNDRNGRTFPQYDEPFSQPLPFHDLDAPQIRKLHGLPPPRGSQPMLVKGNYVAGFTLRNLRMRSKANCKAHGIHNLTSVLDLPTELILEIFQYLHPIDLYNWIRVSKVFRKLLLGYNTLSVWREAFLGVPEIPSCPPDVSFPKWVSMLYGPSTCDECGDPEAMIDFTFRVRRCDTCLDVNRRHKGDFDYFLDHTPVYRNTLWSLVRGSYRDYGMYYPHEEDYLKPTVYSAPEVDKRAAEMKGLIAAVNACAPGAQENYDKYQQDVATATRESMRHIKICNMWCLTIYRGLLSIFRQSLPWIVRKWQMRLVSIGHDAKDVHSAEMQIQIHDILDRLFIKKYTNRDFRRNLPVFEVILKSLKCTRLSQERLERIEKRKGVVDGHYDTYRRELCPELWGYLPEETRIYQIAPIFDYIYSDDPSLTHHAESVNAEINSFVSRWTTFGKALLSNCIPDYQTKMNRFIEASAPDAIDVATTVVICPENERRNIWEGEHLQALIGWDDAGLHLDCIAPRNPRLVKSKYAPSFSFSMAGYHTAVHLLNLLGLSLTTTKANSLDGLKARFMCSTCPFVTKRGAKGRLAMTFKESVSHAINCPGHQPESLVLLAMEATESVLFHEPASFTLPSEPSWSCLHCSDYFRKLAKRKAVILHTQSMHSIQRPTEDLDFLSIKSKDQPLRKQIFIGFDRPTNYRCDRCPDARRRRLWPMSSLLAHLFDKHNIEEPTENIDWHQVELWK